MTVFSAQICILVSLYSYVAWVHCVSSCYAPCSSMTSRHGATCARILVSELPDMLRLVIKLVKDVCGLGLKDAKDLARLAPRPLRKASLGKMQRSSQLNLRQLAQKLKNANNNWNQKRFMWEFSHNNAPKILVIFVYYFEFSTFLAQKFFT